MNPNPVHRLPAPLEHAVQRLKLASRAAVERTIESLGLAALASNNVFQRDNLLGAQFELNRKSAIFALSFNEAFDQRLQREVLPRRADAAPQPTSWDALSLVEDHEVELEVTAERFAQEISQSCEWELRELGAYILPLIGAGGASRGGPETERNPLRPEVVGHAMVRAIEAVSERPEIRKVLTTELGRSLGGLLRGTYAEIVSDLRQAGVQPMGLTVRTVDPRGPAGGAVSGYDTLGRPIGMEPGPPGGSVHGHGYHSAQSGFDSRYGRRSGPSSFGGSTRSGMGMGRGTPIGSVDPALMSVIRRLAFTDIGAGDPSGWGEVGHSGGGIGYALPNLIHAHREELRQASSGSLDHLVIDVIGTLFDQILSDPKVPPQMARLIARLQLPVLRAALGDPKFFASRKHPVRRFVNRIASLGAAFEDFNESAAQRVLAKVKALVNEVVEGDFDQIEVYEQKLAALEGFIAEIGQEEAQAQGGAAELLSAKEDELRLRLLYSQQLEGELKGLSAPDFVRDFISQVWSQVLLRAAEQGGADGERVKRLRHVGRELFMSVQAKTSPQQRKAFLADLPKLMKELGEGMELIAWPEASRREFFGKLLPTHAESLKAAPLRPLDFNMLAKQVDGALDKPLPSRADLKLAPTRLPVLNEAVAVAAPQFSAEEAKRIGLVDESSVDWNGKVDIDLGAEPEISAADVQIAGLPAAPEAAAEPLEPTQGKSLADNVQVGFAYQMHIGDAWQKARLVHISPGRSFFVFHHGKKQRETVSLTHRMLVRLCETGRLRAYEQAQLLERATARARRQLAAVSPAGSASTH